MLYLGGIWLGWYYTYLSCAKLIKIIDIGQPYVCNAIAYLTVVQTWVCNMRKAAKKTHIALILTNLEMVLLAAYLRTYICMCIVHAINSM
jgi:hypothetical protein